MLLVLQLAGPSVRPSLTFMALRYHRQRHILRQPKGVVAGGGVGLSSEHGVPSEAVKPMRENAGVIGGECADFEMGLHGRDERLL